MKIRFAIASFLISFITVTVAQIPKVGRDTTLEAATWNLKWFGDAQNGPSNQALQFTNVKDILNQTDIDVWGLCEVSSLTAYQNLRTALPQYASAIATFSQTQKTALMWKRNMFDSISAQMILTDAQYNYDFAGRPPLEVVLRRKDSLYQDTIYFYVVHLKAYGDESSYNRRKNAAAILKSFLDANRSGKNVIVLGDWNDKLTGSIWTGTTESPFKNLLNDTSHYFYISKQLADEGKRSYVFTSGSMIDHIMMNRFSLDSFYVKNNARVLDMLPSYIASYSSTTSDHYPVMGYFNFKRYHQPPPITGIASIENNLHFNIYPNPATHTIQVMTDTEISSVTITDISGKVVIQTHQTTIDVSRLQTGIYFMHVRKDESFASKKLMITTP